MPGICEILFFDATTLDMSYTTHFANAMSFSPTGPYILSGPSDGSKSVHHTKVAELEDFYNRRQIRMIILVALKRFNASGVNQLTILRRRSQTEVQRAAKVELLFPGVIATRWERCAITGKETVTRSLPIVGLLDMMNRSGRIEDGVAGHILKMI